MALIVERALHAVKHGLIRAAVRIDETATIALYRARQPASRAFYEIEASRESWSVRELERQVAAMLFERLALKGDEKQLAANGQ